MRRLFFSQNIPEQILLQQSLPLLRIENLEIHLDRLPFPCAVQLLLHLVQRKAVSQNLLAGHIGRLIQHRIHRLQAIALVNRRQIHLIRESLLIGNRNGMQIHLLIRRHNPAVQSLPSKCRPVTPV